MARRRRGKPAEEDNVLDELGAAETENIQTEERPRDNGDELAINLDLGYADDEALNEQAERVAQEVLNESPEAGPTAETYKTEADAVSEFIQTAVDAAVDAAVARADRRSRERMIESLRRIAAIEESVTTLGFELPAALEDIAARLERVEEACGLRPSLLSTAESAVAKLDEMAQGGSLRAEDIRAIHRKLRAAVQEERARRQS